MIEIAGVLLVYERRGSRDPDEIIIFTDRDRAVQEYSVRADRGENVVLTATFEVNEEGPLKPEEIATQMALPFGGEG